VKRLVVQKAYQAVHEALEEAILDGRLRTGDSLPTETDLASKFGVTRHTVREGIRVLEQTGFVKREAGRRLFVSLPRYEELAPRSSRALLMQKVTFRELWEVAVQLEVCAADLAVSRNSRKLIDSLRENLAEMEVAIKRSRDVVELDVAFHSLIAEATENRVLLLAREPVSLLLHPALKKLLKHPKTREISPQRLFEAHKYIVRAFQDRDTKAVREWMLKHMIDFRRGYDFAGLDIDDVADSHIEWSRK
jgi:GntR family transcriptional regulator, transcriptional repressor for pyruvate dehydrogenase complex